MAKQAKQKAKPSKVLIDGVEKKNVYVNGVVKPVKEMIASDFEQLKSDWKGSNRKLEII